MNHSKSLINISAKKKRKDKRNLPSENSEAFSVKNMRPINKFRDKPRQLISKSGKSLECWKVQISWKKCFSEKMLGIKINIITCWKVTVLIWLDLKKSRLMTYKVNNKKMLLLLFFSNLDKFHWLEITNLKSVVESVTKSPMKY